MKRSCLFLLTFMLIIGGAAASYAATEEQYLAYFDDNLLPDMQAWIGEAAKKRLLLIGEHHGVADNHALYLEILRSFPDKHIQLVLEMSPSFAFVCNEYLNTGDDALLKSAIVHLQGTFGYTREHVAFWQQVKQLTDAGKTIDVIGVDQEFQLKNTALALLTIDRERFTPVLQSINDAGRSGSDALLQALAAIVKEHENLPVETDKEQAVQDIMLSLAQLLRNPLGDKRRDIPLAQTFARRVNPAIRSLGIFGGQHVTKPPDSGSMLSRLLQEPTLRSELLVAQLFYVDASYMDAATGQAVPLQSLSTDSIIVGHARKQMVQPAVYRLPQSPLFEEPGAKGLSLPALYDYVVVMCQAQAAAPMQIQ